MSENAMYMPSNVNRYGYWWKNNIAQNILTKKYFHDDEIEVAKTDFDKAFNMFVNRVCSIFPDTKIKDFMYKSIWDGDFIPAGRALYGAGAKGKFKSTLSNCYILPKPEDNIESIFDVASKMARIFSTGGGCGVDISNLRPNGAKVSNVAKTSSGAVNFMSVFNMVGEVISQNGRRGATLIAMDCTHPDIEEFLTVKQNNTAIQMANISIKFTDDFMRAVENDEEVTLRFNTKATGELIERKINAKDFFERFAKSQWDFAEPAALFIDRVNHWNILSEYDDYHVDTTNPCVTGDTLILTKNGYIPIADLVNQEVEVWNGYRWSMATPKVTGHNQKMLRVTFSNGMHIDCTEYHKFLLKDKTRKQAKDLQVGDKLPKYDFPIITPFEISENMLAPNEAYTMGFYCGDGTKDKKQIKLYGKKIALLKHFWHHHALKQQDGAINVILNEQYTKDYVPCDYDIQEKLWWLAGLIDSDGSLNSKEGALNISSINRKFLEKVLLLLNTLGATGTIGVMHVEKDKLMPANDGSGGQKEYHCQECYRLCISAYNVSQLLKLGLTTHRVQLVAQPNRNASRFIYVTDIQETKDADTVYCMTEPYNHTFVANGILTGNCGEFAGNAFNSCVTGDTLIHTTDGIRQIRDMVDTTGYVLTEKKFEKYHNVVSKGIKPVYKITIDGGHTIKTTDNHKFYINGEWKQVKDISIGDKVQFCTNAFCRPIPDYDDTYTMYGWLHGDGWFNTTIGISFNEKDGDYDAKEVLMPLFRKEFFAENIKATEPTSTVTKDKQRVSVQLQCANKKAIDKALSLGFIPSRHKDKQLPSTFYQWTLKQQISFIRGLMSADGFITCNSSLGIDSDSQHRQIAFASNSEVLVYQLQKYFASMGIVSRINKTVFNTEKRNPQYKLSITKESAVRYFSVFGFCCQRKNDKFNSNYGQGQTFRNYTNLPITNVEYVGEEEVFDILEVENTNAFYANGIYIHNCNLASINLYNMVKNPFTDKAEVDYFKLDTVVKNAVTAMNDILDYGYDTQPLDENRKCIDDWRSIGLGVFGIADMLVALGIPYGSQEANSVIGEVMSEIQFYSFSQSIKEAKIHGAFDKFDYEKTLASPYVQKMLLCQTNTVSNNLKESLRRYGLRNGTLLAIAPTGSISMLFSESGGVEPYYQVSYERTTHQLEKQNKTFHISMLAVDHLLKHHNLDKDNLTVEQIKKKFPFVVDTYDINPMDRVKMQAVMQGYVDNAISSTVNLKESATWKDIYNLYLEAWWQGCKGITVFRDNCERISILGKDHGNSTAKINGNVTQQPSEESMYNNHTPKKLNHIVPQKRGDTSQSLWGRTFLYHTACVPKFYVTVNIKDGEIFEVFVGADKGCQANINTITRLTSLCLRSGITVDEIVKNLESAVCPACTALRNKGDKDINKSCASCVASAIREMAKTLSSGKNDAQTANDFVEVELPVDVKMQKVNITPQLKEMMECPECHKRTLIPDGKCAYCNNCGYSKC